MDHHSASEGRHVKANTTYLVLMGELVALSERLEYKIVAEHVENDALKDAYLKEVLELGVNRDEVEFIVLVVTISILPRSFMVWH